MLTNRTACAVALVVGFSGLGCALLMGGGVPRGSKWFISPMDGNLDGFISSEIIKQKIPVVIVTDEKDADFVLAGASVKADDRWYNVVFGGKDKNEGNVRLLSVKDKTMVWAGEAGDRSLIWGASDVVVSARSQIASLSG